MQYISLGLKRDRALEIAELTKHQYYHKPKKGKRGVPPSTHTTIYVEDQEVLVTNAEVVEQIKLIHSEPDIDYGYQKMTTALKIAGVHINHKDKKDEEKICEIQSGLPSRTLAFTGDGHQIRVDRICSTTWLHPHDNRCIHQTSAGMGGCNEHQSAYGQENMGGDHHRSIASQ